MNETEFITTVKIDVYQIDFLIEKMIFTVKLIDCKILHLILVTNFDE